VTIDGETHNAARPGHATGLLMLSIAANVRVQPATYMTTACWAPLRSSNQNGIRCIDNTVRW